MNRRAFLVTGAGAGVALAASATSARGAESATAANKAVARRFTEELWGGHKAELVDELIAADFVNHNPFPGTDGDREGEKKAVLLHGAAMGDPEGKVEDQIAEGDKVATRWMFVATHRGKFMGIAPTGKRVKISGVNILRIADGKIVELWREVDVFGMLQQLGATPPHPVGT